jgi:hypothetical protein
MQPSSSSLATAIAAAHNLVCYPPNMPLDCKPDGAGAEQVKKWAELVGDCAKIIHDKVGGA